MQVVQLRKERRRERARHQQRKMILGQAGKDRGLMQRLWRGERRGGFRDGGRGGGVAQETRVKGGGVKDQCSSGGGVVQVEGR